MIRLARCAAKSRRFALAAAMASLTVASVAQSVEPPNDDFDAATVIVALAFVDTQDTREATAAPDDPVSCTNNGSVWYAYTPPVDTVLVANTFGSDFDTVLSAYTGTRGSLVEVPSACNDDFQGLQSRVSFPAQAGTTYYFLVGFCCGFGGTGGGDLEFTLEEVTLPPNDNFADASFVTSVPFNDNVNTSGATIEPSEPQPSCGFGSLEASVWWSFTAETTESLSAAAIGPFSTVVAVYAGESLGALSEIACGSFGDLATFQAEAGITYHFQAGGVFPGDAGPLQFNLDVASPPQAFFSFFPSDPSAFQTVQFFDNSFDPAGVGIETQLWDFGDGASDTDCCPIHQYAADADYSVELTVTTFDGRSASASQVVSVETHDVAITRFSAPKAARAGQTRTLSVGLNSRLRPEEVEVELFRSVPGGGFERIGSLTQQVPVRNGNRTTNFPFSYTFTANDASVGKVTFRATATLLGARDAFPADNEAIAPPTTVH